jgi:hypothetical protein
MKINTSSTAEDISAMPVTPNKNQGIIFTGANPLHRHVFERTQDHDGGDRNHQNMKKTLKPSTRTMFQKARPGACAMNHVAPSAASGSHQGDQPQNLLTLLLIEQRIEHHHHMPKTERTSSGRMRT